MGLKIAVCDDVLADRQQLILLIKAEASYCECSAYESGELLLWDFENGTHFDIIFLDIFMEGMSGVETAKCIRMADPNALLIFVSNSNDFYRESYDLFAFNYLIKPLTGDKLAEVLRRAISHLGKDADQVVRFSYNNNLHTVRCSQLLYLTSDKHIVNFHLINGETLKSYGKIDDFVSQLPAEVFVRCHQSYIINMEHVTGMTTCEFMFGQVKVPVSRKYSVQAHEKYRAMMFHDF
jgi:DNA-binding LytR/AlgR family response regulator